MINASRLFYHIESRERTQSFRYEDAFRRLVVLQQGGHDTRQSQRAAVERVGQLRLAVGVAVAQFQTVGLERLEVGDGLNLQPALLGGRPHLEVVGEG